MHVALAFLLAAVTPLLLACALALRSGLATLEIACPLTARPGAKG